jgi:hypothetical protein
VKYMILIQSNPQFVERLQALPKEQRERFGRDHLALIAELADAGELVASEGLADPALGKRVTVAGGQTMISDGPFAEAKEHLAGFYLIDCDGIERAVALAARIPEAAHGLVEVRPTLRLSDFGDLET